MLSYSGMPKAAQHLPREEDLAAERGVDLDVCQCAGCGLVQLGNEPVPYYRDVIRAAAVSPEMADFRRRQFRAFVRNYGLVGRKVLEVGCGRGEFLALLQTSGAKAFGLEHQAEAVTWCRRNGLKVSRGFVERADTAIPSGPYAGFMILNFLEHLPEPGVVLRGIGANLTADGVGLVEVPNFDMIISRRLYSEFINDHLFYFTEETLCRLLSINGFEVIRCRTVWHNYILSAVVRKRPRLDLRGFEKQRDRMSKELRRFAKRFVDRGEKVAVWGAGHQALAVLALAKMAPLISYVVDSAEFKQGRYTPASHLRIVPPRTLATEPVAAVIVMAASYSDEVLRIIQKDFGPGMTVAVLREDGLDVNLAPGTSK